MTILIEERSSQFFASRHFIAYPIGGGHYAIVRSGILLLKNEQAATSPNGFKGESSWRGEQFRIRLDLAQSIRRLNPPAPASGYHWAFDMDQWAPIASLNSIFNANVSNNAGSSVNTFAIVQSGAQDFVTLVMDVAERDTDGYLYRIGFYVTLVGRLVQVQDDVTQIVRDEE
jgi:hypothetical protein